MQPQRRMQKKKRRLAKEKNSAKERRKWRKHGARPQRRMQITSARPSYQRSARIHSAMQNRQNPAKLRNRTHDLRTQELMQ